jgi:hypothetical protein
MTDCRRKVIEAGCELVAKRHEIAGFGSFIASIIPLSLQVFRMQKVRCGILCGIALLAGLAGCGRSDAELAAVAGRVTFDGQPLAGARVMFQPETTGSPSYGATDGEGRYELGYKRGVTGAMIGRHVVRIQLDAAAAGSNGSTSARPKSLPARYNTQSELRAEVKAGEDNVIDLNLKSEKQPRRTPQYSGEN